jgi:hypothetical protein
MANTVIMWAWVGFSAVCLVVLAIAIYWRNL